MPAGFLQSALFTLMGTISRRPLRSLRKPCRSLLRTAKQSSPTITAAEIVRLCWPTEASSTKRAGLRRRMLSSPPVFKSWPSISADTDHGTAPAVMTRSARRSNWTCSSLCASRPHAKNPLPARRNSLWNHLDCVIIPSRISKLLVQEVIECRSSLWAVPGVSGGKLLSSSRKAALMSPHWCAVAETMQSLSN